MLFTLCRPCARKLHIYDTLLPALSVRPCVGCGTLVGYEFERVQAKTESGEVVHIPRFTRLVAPYTHIWQSWAWPIAWGIVLQDNFGTHEHEWERAMWAREWQGKIDYRKERCRCGQSREFWKDPEGNPRLPPVNIVGSKDGQLVADTPNWKLPR